MKMKIKDCGCYNFKTCKECPFNNNCEWIYVIHENFGEAFARFNEEITTKLNEEIEIKDE